MISVPARQLHVLYVAWGFVPHRGPGAYRPLATVNELARRGHRVTVLTADLDTFAIAVGADESLVARVHPDVRIVRVPMLQDVRDPVINRWSLERAENQRPWTQAVLDQQTQAFPEPVYAPWGPRAEAVALRLHATDPVDLTMATGNPYVDFTVALTLHQEHNVPFVLDDRDSWILDVYTGELAPHADRIRPWLDHALDTATEMWFVNPPIADWHRREYPQHADKIRVVENGWDSTFLHPGGLSTSRSARRSLVMSYVGTINSGLPLELIGDAWRIARSRSELLASSELRMVGHFGHAGSMTPEQVRIRRKYGPDRMRFVGRQPKERISEVYAQSDILLFAKEGTGLVTSGKVYEYIATGRPIVSSMASSHDARRVLAGYPRWHDASADGGAVALADAMLEGAADAVGGEDLESAALEYGAGFRRDAVLARAIDHLEQRLPR